MRFPKPPLPYSFAALEPHISRKTLKEHYSHHQMGYLEKLNGLSIIEQMPKGTTLEEIVLRSAPERAQRGIGFLPPAPQAVAVYNMAAQVYNHAFYWHSMRKNGGGEPTGLIAKLIRASFSSPENFRRLVKERGMMSFGSGWIWICLIQGELAIIEGHDAECPIAYQGYHPLLVIDVWEHAWYIDYKHDKEAYLDAVLDNLINWDFANQNLNAAR